MVVKRPLNDMFPTLWPHLTYAADFFVRLMVYVGRTYKITEGTYKIVE